MAQSDAETGSDISEDQDFHDNLKPGTELLGGQYKIEQYLNAGGFGVTYIARDSLDRKVVIKECFPSAFCHRVGENLQVRSRSNEDKVRTIVDRFEQEARALAKFSHPNIVGVHQVFKQNNTAYMVLDYVSGKDISEMVEANDPMLTQANVVMLVTKLLKAVGFVHDHSMLHRDISPDNILVTPQGEPILIDFGAAKEKLPGDTRALSTLRAVKDGYSPQEFYIAESEQSPASDLYSLAATFYYVVTREVPADSQTRLAAIASDQTDPVVPLTKRSTDLYDVAFCAALDKAMSVLLKDRVQTAEEWLAMMNGDSKVTPLSARQPRQDPHAAPPKPALDAATAAETDKVVPRRPQSAPISRPRPMTAPKTAPRTMPKTAPLAVAPARKSSLPLVLASVSVLAIAAGAYVMFGSSKPETDTAAAPELTVPAEETLAIAAPEAVETPVVEAPVVEAPVVEAPVVEAPVVAAESEAPEPEAPVVEEPLVVTAEPETPEVVVAEPEAPVAEAPAEEAAAEEAPVVVEAPVIEAPELAAAPEPAPAPEPEPEQLAAAAPVVEAPVVTPEPEASALDTLTASDPGAFPAAEETDTRPVEDVLEAAAVTDAPAAPSFIELQSVLTRVSVQLPFEAAPNDRAAIGEIIAPTPVWAAPGTRILSVNGIEVAALSDIPDVVKDEAAATDAATLPLTFEIADPAGGTTERTLQVPVVRQYVLLNGLRFEAQLVGDAWVTRIASLGNLGDSRFEVGDQVVALVATSERIDGPTSIRDVIERETAAGNAHLTFAVRRDGSMYVETLTYAGIAK